MLIQELVPLGPKTTMRIGGSARYYADIATRQDAEEAWHFAKEKNLPLIVLGGGSNTIFADGTVEALVIRIKADAVVREGGIVTVQAGKILASLINELATAGYDLSTLTGIPGTIGGAIFGNAGQGKKGIWLDHYAKEVVAYVDGAWKTFSKEDCGFEYRESMFKHLGSPAIIWEATLEVPPGDPATIKAEIERLIKKRIETQPHLKTAGSCFKSLPDGTMAWQLIDAAGLRGFKVGGIQVSEKHANFLLNVEKGTFEDAQHIVTAIREKVPQIPGIEMRFYDAQGKIAT